MDERFFGYKGRLYPSYLKAGHAADFIIPFASQFCKGYGLDIGGTKDCHFIGAKIVNIELNNGFHALNLPPGKYDYIFSSHTLEHVFRCSATLQHWKKHLREEGVLFLYLPHPDMIYWRPENCRKHKWSFTPKEITALLNDLKFDVMLYSERDLFWSFAVVAMNRS